MTNAYFIRKPAFRCEILRREEAAEQGYQPEPYNIQEDITLTIAEYDAFIARPLVSRSWLAGKGGFRNGRIQVVAVGAQARPTLLVNPEGSDYARYVAYK
jgi:hypothetical protein